jgi:phage gpG-like protein
VRMTIEAYGHKEVSHKFRRVGIQAMKPKPAMEKIIDRMIEIEKTTFDSQGHRGGGSWRALSPGWAARKAAMGRDARILRSTGALYRSLTSKQSSNMIRETEGFTIKFGSKLPYAARHQHGDDRIPQRKYIDFTRTDVQGFSRIVIRHITSPFKVGTVKGARSR